MIISKTFVFIICIFCLALPMTAKISGLWLPLVTPFKDGAVDFSSYERLIEHYVG